MHAGSLDSGWRFATPLVGQDATRRAGSRRSNEHVVAEQHSFTKPCQTWTSRCSSLALSVQLCPVDSDRSARASTASTCPLTFLQCDFSHGTLPCMLHGPSVAVNMEVGIRFCFVRARRLYREHAEKWAVPQLPGLSRGGLDRDETRLPFPVSNCALTLTHRLWRQLRTSAPRDKLTFSAPKVAAWLR